MRLAAVLAVAATPCLAQTDGGDHPQRADFLAFLGGQGCTLSPDSVDRAEAAGFAREDVRAMTAAAQAAGEAIEQGSYIVFGPQVCTLRLPDIASAYTVDHPDVRAQAAYSRETYDVGDGIVVDEGCFLQDAAEVFTLLEGRDRRAGYRSFMAFLGAGLISGDLRFYEISPLKTPKGFQIMTGADCASAPNAQQVNASHAFVLDGFADYVRFVGETTECGDPISFEVGEYTAQMQGFDFDAPLLDQPPVNAWLHMEFLLITLAAGWHEGASDVEPGTPRPPLCHYPG